MEFFRNTHIDFMRYRRIWLAVSGLAIVVSMVLLFGLKRLNVGIEFAGGTQITMRFAEAPQVDELRALFSGAQIDTPQLQRFGEDDANEVILKTRSITGDEVDPETAVIAALDGKMNPDLGGRLDLNLRGTAALQSLLATEDPDRVATTPGDEAAVEHYQAVAAAVMGLKKDHGLLESWERIGGLPEVTPASLEVLRAKAALGKFTVLSTESVGPQIGSELRTKGILAVVFSLIGMMAYIWLRFELRFGIGAVVASAHDVAITLGAFVLANHEFNLTSIAAFLTVVGYSVNDTVVIFDRVRENLRRNRREPLAKVLNDSLNQTLSRTVLTTGTTLLAVVTLFLIGGEAIQGFAFVLMVGIVVGTYSSVYIASPIVLLWEQRFGREARERRATQAA